jgi:hypothetical protein
MLGIREAMILSHCCWSEYRTVYPLVSVEVYYMRDTEGGKKEKEAGANILRVNKWDPSK